MPRTSVPITSSIRFPWSIRTGYVFMVTFVGIRSPPWSLPAPPRRRIALCPSLSFFFFFFFFFQLPQGRQCLFEVRSVPDWALYRNQLCSNESTNYFCNRQFLVELNGGCGLRPQGHPFGFDRCQSCSCGTFRHVWIGRGYPGSTSFCTSSWVNGRCSILCPLVSSRNGARGVALSLYSS